MKVEHYCRGALYAIVGISVFQALIGEYLGFHQCNYLCDVLLILLLIVRMWESKGAFIYTLKRVEYLPIAAFGVVILLGWFMNGVPLLHALWGMRNYGRFFLFFILVVDFLGPQDAINLEEFFLKLFPIHITLVVFQYFVGGHKQDALSGLFGTITGGNGGMAIYFCILLCIMLSRMEYGKMRYPQFLSYLALMAVNTAASELKFFFVIAVCIAGWYVVVSQKKKRAVTLAVIVCIAMFLGMQLMYQIFPFWTGYLNPTNIPEVITSQTVYSTSTDIGRTAVFSKLTPMITEWSGKGALAWGIGLGNADYSDGFSFLNSEFYTVHQASHYTWLSLGYLFSETGYLGTISYLAFFGVLELRALWRYYLKRTRLQMLGTFFPFVALALIVYNSTMRSNFAYMMFVMLAFSMLEKEKSPQRNTMFRGEKHLEE